MRLSLVYISVAFALKSNGREVDHDYWIYGYMKDPFSGFFNRW